MSNSNQLNEILKYLAQFHPIVGTIEMYAGQEAPAGWLICDGSAISRTTYAKLFEVIGQTYGAGDGSTTFNLPDFKGRTAIGVGTGTASTSTAHALGQNNGQETHTLTENELPVVTGYVDTRMTGANGAATYFNPTGVFSHSYFTPASDMSTLSFTTGIKKSDRLSFSMGSGQAHNNMQPYLTVNYIISTGKND